MRKPLLASIAAAALALSACGGDTDTTVETPPTVESAMPSEEEAAPEPTAAEPEQTEAGEPPAETTEAPAEPSEAQTTVAPEVELTAVEGDARKPIDAFLAAHEGAEEIPMEQLSPAAGDDGLTIEPPECADTMQAGQDPELLAGAAIGGAMHQSETSATSLTVLEFPDAAQATRNAEVSRTNAETCPEVTMVMAGQRLPMTLRILPADGVSGADEAFILENSLSLDESFDQVTHTAIAVLGARYLAVSVGSIDGNPDPSIAEAELADAVAALG